MFSCFFLSPRQCQRAALAAILTLLLSSNAQAATEAQLQPAFALFTQAISGQTSAIEPAAEAFAALLKAEPTDPVLLAYSGAATSMKANTTWLPWKKLGFAEDGLAQLDKALALLTPAHQALLHNGTPVLLEVKFVAASTFLALPGFMNRHDRGAKLLDEVLGSALLAAAALPFKGAVWLKAAEQAAKAGNADAVRRYATQLIQGKAPQSAQAQALLKGLKS